MRRIKTYTVVGIHTDNDQRYADHFSAASPENAEAAALREAKARGEGDLLIAGVFEGALTALT